MSEKKSKSWGELSSGEKTAVILGWLAIIAVAGWFFLPGKEEPSEVSAVVTTAPTTAPAATFQTASPEALAAATTFVGALDKAMLDGADVLQVGDLATISKHSQDLSALMKSGRSQFGSSVFEPLGYCFSAGVHAQSWWLAQIRAAGKGGVEPVPGEIMSILKQYQEHRAACLEYADPAIAAQAKAELKEKTGGGRECLISIDVDPETKQVVAKPKPVHCKS
ncbi:hypothetical protein ACP0IK_28405 [Pseudomonas aeruginosa]|uniref:hypothetical protein n=1 Tax=Pseudomonas aeruginosa TaxID=287 RepID=UPI000DF89BB4|nr:hypothetical protein [Pseudomonas aeruginosa]RCM51479.1 hypothetical protein PA82_03370 [Pseudomonas aeruginosa]HCT4763199.1 hypothetical protein [Pseudomonas aeruginosa]HDZ6692567.1 hypothetical protein [Pseudomonas aeruginosa]